MVTKYINKTNDNKVNAIIGHVSTSTTLNIYAHTTDQMRKTGCAQN